MIETAAESIVPPTIQSGNEDSTTNSSLPIAKSDTLSQEEIAKQDRLRHKKEALQALTSSSSSHSTTSTSVNSSQDSFTPDNSEKRNTGLSDSSVTESDNVSYPPDIIPNAIVIKNINFVIPRNVLLSTISQLNLPIPYAFNYHYEGNLFRGLAFANFHSNDDAAKVIAGLNGLYLAGRELKVEYKKVQEKPTNKAAIVPNVSQKNLNIPIDTSSKIGSYLKPPQQSSNRFRNNDFLSRRATISENSPFSTISPTLSNSSNFNFSTPLSRFSNSNPADSNSNLDDNLKSLIDLSDKDTRLLYDLISQFRRDKSVAELDFPSAINSTQRQTIMLIAEHFGLNHETKNDNLGYRKIRVFKSLETLLEATEIKSHLQNNSSNINDYNKSSLNSNHNLKHLHRQSMISPRHPLNDSSNSYDFKKFSNFNRNQQNSNRSSMYAGEPQKNSFRSSSIYLPTSSSDNRRSSIYNNTAGNRSSLVSFPGLSTLTSSFSNPSNDQKNVASPLGINSDSYNSHQNSDNKIAQRHMQLKVLEEKRIRRLSSVTTSSPYSNTSSQPAVASIPLSSVLTTKKLDVAPASKAIPIVSPSSTRSPGTITMTKPSPPPLIQRKPTAATATKKIQLSKSNESRTSASSPVPSAQVSNTTS
ncbi:RNA-binding protein PIN4 [Smittium culicis]|uniref:RNA-binding protein PIN4 n=2 Tax=Smittium culicis TaxID=133412 RepID=A0A1R1WXP8_9FUNG|nr:RNA-binding protein PIN4 [Smittium culicis]